MTRAPAPTHDAPLPPLAVLRIVAGLVGVILAQLLPALVRRPDLRMPLLRATRALAAAGGAYALKRDGAALKLRAAVLALRDVLLAIVEEDEGWPSPAPSPRTVRARLSASRTFVATRSALVRARDGPHPARKPAA